MKRNDYILKRLVLLNIKSVQEGLLQILNYTKTEIHKHRCLAMVLFLPNVDQIDDIEKVDEDIVMNPQVNIVSSAIEFCNKYSVSSASCKVFVNNIDFKVRQNEFWTFFEHFGKVLRVYIAKDKRTKRSKGFGFVVFSSPFDAQKALNAKKYELKLNGRLVQVLPAVNKKKKNTNTIQDDPVKAKLKIKEAADYFIENKSEVELEMKMDAVLDDNAIISSNSLINNILCDDMLLEIFSYMDLRSRVKLELVCKRWYNLAIRSWGHISHLCFNNVFNLSHTHASLTDRILISILNKNCVNLKSIDISASPYLISHSSLFKIANTCLNLEEINLSYVHLKKDSAKVLGRNLTNLKKIHLSNCLNIGEKAFWWLFKDQVHLEELLITDTSRLIGNCIYMLPSTIKLINFENCSEFNDVGLKYLSTRCPNLSHLNLSFCVNISDDGLDTLLRKCKNITELNLKGLGRKISKTGFMYITRLEKLVDLDISRNTAVTDEVLRSVALKCKNLQKLSIEACHGDITRSGIISLCNCLNLIELNISYIIHVTDECVSELAMEGNLQKFIIRSSPEISDKCAVTCIEYLDNLHVLDLSGCFYITDEFPKLLNLKILDRSSSSQLQIILGGTQVTEYGMTLLQEKLKFSMATMQNLQVGMLRNDRDPTLVRAFFPESSDEEEEEEEVQPELIVLKPDVQFNVEEDYPTCDEDGESLWVTMTPNQTEISKDGQYDITPVENVMASDICDLQLSPVFTNSSFNLGKNEDEENWDDELEEGRVWDFPIESLNRFNMFGSNLNEDYDDFLENDDLSRLELIG